MPKQKIKFWPCSKYTSWNEIPCELLLPNVITSFSVAGSNICGLQTHLKFFFNAVFSENYFLCLSWGSSAEQGLLGGYFFIQTIISSTSCARGHLCVGCCIFQPGFRCCAPQTLVEIVIFIIFCDFDQHLGCAAPKRWSKYTSMGNCLSVEWLSPGHVRNHCEWHASLQAQCYSVT